MITFIIFFIFFVFITGFIIYDSLKLGISPTPTSGKVKKVMLTNLPPLSNIKILELGAGWGSLAFPLAKKYSTCEIHAYEFALIPWVALVIRSFFQKRKNLLLKRKNFFDDSFEKASVVICYLYPKAMQKLKEKFIKELAPNTLILTNTFALDGWEALNIYEVKDIYHTKVYRYQMKV